MTHERGDIFNGLSFIKTELSDFLKKLEVVSNGRGNS